MNNILNYETAKCDLCKNNVSKGELKIANLLKNNSINFLTQYIFEDCKLDSYLRFDFYLPNTNIVIEYDGIQHFKPVDLFGGEKEYELTRKRDEVKNNYCKHNNIKLIRINYKDFKNIESILVDNKIIPSQAS